MAIRISPRRRSSRIHIFWFRESIARDVEAQAAMDINLLSVGFMIFARKFGAAM
jgi:hypothetical protein